MDLQAQWRRLTAEGSGTVLQVQIELGEADLVENVSDGALEDISVRSVQLV